MENKNFLEVILRTIKSKSHKNKKSRVKGKGSFNSVINFIGEYKTLKVVPRSKRTKENSDKFGIAKKE